MAADDPSAYTEPDYALSETHRVALFDKPDQGHNTIVLAGLDLVLPVELDADGDPLSDDTVRVRSLDGYREHVRTLGHLDVRVDADKRLVFYRFRHLLCGAYRVAIRIGATWAPLGNRLIVARDGAYWNDTKLDPAPPDSKPGEAEGLIGDDWMDDLHADPREELSCGGRPPEED